MITTSNAAETYAVAGMMDFFSLSPEKNPLDNGGTEFSLDAEDLEFMRREIDGEN